MRKRVPPGWLRDMQRRPPSYTHQVPINIRNQDGYNNIAYSDPPFPHASDSILAFASATARSTASAMDSFSAPATLA